MEDRDRELLLCLCRKVRVLALPQAAEAFYAGLLPSARRSFRRLEANGFVQVSKRPAKVLSASPPLYSGSPETDPPPDFAAIVEAARHRFNGSTLQTIIAPTRKAANLVGGRPGDSALAELDHDLYLSSVVLALPPEEYCAFVHEDLLPEEPGEKPDGIIQLMPSVLVDVVGSSYTVDRCTGLFELARASDLHVRFY